MNIVKTIISYTTVDKIIVKLFTEIPPILGWDSELHVQCHVVVYLKYQSNARPR